MKAIGSVLVSVDALEPQQAVIDRAVAVARAAKARLRFVDVLSVPADVRAYLPLNVVEDLRVRRSDELQRLARTVSDLEVEWCLLDGRPSRALIREVLKSNHDLIIQARVGDRAEPTIQPFFGPFEMNLLRQCPCPVWLVGNSSPFDGVTILGAVHATPDDPGEQALNTKIIEWTLHLATVANGTPALVQAWEPFAERLVHASMPETDFRSYVDAGRRQAEAELQGLTRAFGTRLATVRVENRRGKPDHVIADVAKTSRVDTVVLGTVARTGVSGLVIGNTAERVLHRLECSVLAVKPDDFVSPVRPD